MKVIMNEIGMSILYLGFGLSYVALMMYFLQSIV